MKRIQHKRGQKLPSGAKLVARPSRWGNPYKVSEYGRDDAIRMYKADIELMTNGEMREWLAPLKDATALACYCPLDVPCHADVLIDLLVMEP